jgi:hypothetical protein
MSSYTVYRYEYPVRLTCQVLEASHSGYCGFLGRRGDGIRRAELIARIREAHRHSVAFAGSSASCTSCGTCPVIRSRPAFAGPSTRGIPPDIMNNCQCPTQGLEGQTAVCPSVGSLLFLAAGQEGSAHSYCQDGEQCSVDQDPGSVGIGCLW